HPEILRLPGRLRGLRDYSLTDLWRRRRAQLAGRRRGRCGRSRSGPDCQPDARRGGAQAREV
ncbi:unnamed protein product, partial [Prorocentrum cordatum]